MKFIDQFLFFFFSFASYSQAATNHKMIENCINSNTEIELKLQCLDFVSIKEIKNHQLGPNARYFELKWSQPHDHQDFSKGHFQQRVVLLHRDFNQPTVYLTSGYDIEGIGSTPITDALEANQVQIEIRYFGTSKPTKDLKKIDWKNYNDFQVAADFHQVYKYLKMIYAKAWINTGASEGGFRSLLYRKYYPNDMNGTLAWVTPISYSTADKRYLTFLDQVGGAKYANCRQKIKAMQINLLKNKNELSKKLVGQYSILGSKTAAYEQAVVDFNFVYWQHKNPEDIQYGCEKIPADSSLQKQFDFVNEVTQIISNYTDQAINAYLPFYISMAQFSGYPEMYSEDILPYVNEARTILNYVPDWYEQEYKPRFNTKRPLELTQWLQNKATNIILVYGEFDSWTAGGINLSNPEKNLFTYTIAKTNHKLNLPQLNQREKAVILKNVRSFLKTTQP